MINNAITYFDGAPMGIQVAMIAVGVFTLAILVLAVKLVFRGDV